MFIQIVMMKYLQMNRVTSLGLSQCIQNQQSFIWFSFLTFIQDKGRMGLSCPSAFRKPQQSPSVFNMIVIGFKNSGKTSVIASLGTDHEQTQGLDNSLGKTELNISSFTLNDKIRMIVFEVCSPAVKTWKTYYPNADLLLFVIDSHKLLIDQEKQMQNIGLVLAEVDNNISSQCKIIVVFNKMDLLPHKTCPGMDKIMGTMDLRHQVATVKCSTLTKEGISKLVSTLISIHHFVNL